MARQNQSANPSCANNTTNWASNVAVTRVTGLSGPPRTTGASVTTGAGAFNGHFRMGAVNDTSKGTTWTCLAWVRSAVARTFRPLMSLYNGTTLVSTHTSSIGDQALAANVWAEWVFTVTVPAAAGNHTLKYLHIDYPVAGTAGTLTGSSVRIEQVSDLSMDYADGDSAGWTWLGTAGNSVSEELPPQQRRLFLPF